ncbi:winged helix-turn-helix domain-containing protein [Amycolatopsis methanolica]|uniref:Transcriptional regulator, GntR family n=1 Tax=Amycolatopsis methanolica 239 TaxID=1068978 RepID=A0A076MI94_AMYME|nr:transcriptional regulator, GntR family [Amycolatopsis methanolica 239]
MTVPEFDPTAKPGYIYEMMADHLEARIEAGELRPNTPLPAERRLATEYGVSLGTARHATQILRERGLVFTIRSKGTFIADEARRSANRGDS